MNSAFNDQPTEDLHPLVEARILVDEWLKDFRVSQDRHAALCAFATSHLAGFAISADLNAAIGDIFVEILSIDPSENSEAEMARFVAQTMDVI